MLKPLIELLQQIVNLLKLFLDRSVKTGKDFGEKGKKWSVWAGSRLKPPKFRSWQSSLWASALIGLASFFAAGLLGLAATLGWQLFLLLGLFWFAKEVAQSLTPWIIAAPISAFLYFNLRSLGDVPIGVANLAIVAFPLIAAAFALWPDLRQKEGDRALKWKRSLLILGSHLLLACWLQFHFVLQGWLRDYPTFFADDLTDSAFAARVGWQQEEPLTRGPALLDGIGNELKAQLHNKSWDALPPLTSQNINERIANIKQAVGAGIASPAENQLWKVQTDITPRGNGAIIYLEALWEGPRNKLPRIDSAKLCEIDRGFANINRRNQAVAIVECQPARKADRPEPKAG